MKKHIICCCFAAACCVGMTACEKKDDHVHDYADTSVVAPTRENQGYTLRTCKTCNGQTKLYTGATGQELPKDKNYSVLFIGNSYTYVNELWNIFLSIAKEEGFTNVSTDQVTDGGYTLIGFANPEDRMGKKVEEKLTENSYDFIFVQEQSLRPAISPDLFYEGAEALHERIAKTGARDIFYMTWGRKEGCPELDAYGMTYLDMVQKLAAAYEGMGEKLGVPVSAAGAAFYKVSLSHPEIELYHADMSHPSLAGSYLAGLCHYAALFGRSPIGVAYIPAQISLDTADILQHAAHEAVFGGSIVTDEYRVKL